MRKILLLACAGVTAMFLIAAFTTAASACPMHGLETAQIPMPDTTVAEGKIKLPIEPKAGS